MSDDRLEALEIAAGSMPPSEPAPVRIESIKICGYKFFHGDFELQVNGKNLLLYGENGSGKSSIYQALEYLAKTQYASIAKDKNIFPGAAEPSIEFKFSNGKELTIDSDLTDLPSGMEFIRGLSVFSPLLDYKKLLKVHYTPADSGGQVDVYALLRDIFKDYPDVKGKRLSQITDFSEYFGALETIVNGDLLGEINALLKCFENDFKISRFSFKVTMDGKGLPEPSSIIDIDYKGNPIERYHHFLNEARLSALAISIYFAAIIRLLGFSDKGCLRILALDDLLISLDMGNRFRLIEILKTRFEAFQIFFFTHDKELFEICKDKMDWEKYEIYKDDVAGIPVPMLKPHKTEIQRAKVQFGLNELDCCLILLRKALERFLHYYLLPVDQRDRHGDALDLASLLSKAISKSTGERKAILERINTDRKYLYNPACHHDDGPVFKAEVSASIGELEKLIATLK